MSTTILNNDGTYNPSDTIVERARDAGRSLPTTMKGLQDDLEFHTGAPNFPCLFHLIFCTTKSETVRRAIHLEILADPKSKTMGHSKLQKWVRLCRFIHSEAAYIAIAAALDHVFVRLSRRPSSRVTKRDLDKAFGFMMDEVALHPFREPPVDKDYEELRARAVSEFPLLLALPERKPNPIVEPEEFRHVEIVRGFFMARKKEIENGVAEEESVAVKSARQYALDMEDDDEAEDTD